MSSVQPIRPAATVILVRDAARDFQIFMLRRTSDAAFAGGIVVFPGGRVDGDDHLHSYDRWRQGPADWQLPQQRALGDEWRGFWIAVIQRFERYRSPLHAGAISLADICAAENLRLTVDRVHFYNRFITPVGRPRRFDTEADLLAAAAARTTFPIFRPQVPVDLPNGR
jgi:8-oxo-dGTP pyrophosphatase MutT (NUDIX family)